MPKPRIMFYHDGRHPHIYRYEPPMQKEEYQACIDELVGTPIEAVMFCLGEGRTVLHDTKVGELLGHNVDKWDHLVFHRAHQNAKNLIDEGMIHCVSSASGHTRKGSYSIPPCLSRISVRRWHQCAVQISAGRTAIWKSVRVAT